MKPRTAQPFSSLDSNSLMILLWKATHSLHYQRSVNKDPGMLVALEPLAKDRAMNRLFSPDNEGSSNFLTK